MEIVTEKRLPPLAALADGGVLWLTTGEVGSLLPSATRDSADSTAGGASTAPVDSIGVVCELPALPLSSSSLPPVTFAAPSTRRMGSRLLYPGGCASIKLDARQLCRPIIDTRRLLMYGEVAGRPIADGWMRLA